MQGALPDVQRVDDYRWRIPRQGVMRVDGMIYANDKLDQKTYVDWSRGGYASFSAPPWAEKGLLGATIHCLVHAGAAIEKLEVIWEVP